MSTKLMLLATIVAVGLVGCEHRVAQKENTEPFVYDERTHTMFIQPERKKIPAPFRLQDPSFTIDCPDDMRTLWPSNRETAEAMGSDDYAKFGRSKWQAEHTFCVPESY